MGGDDIDELAGRDDLGFLPELGEMALVAGNEIVGAGGIGTFEEDIAGRIGGDLKGLQGRDHVGAVINELKELKAEAFADTEFTAGKDCLVFRKDWGRHVEASWFGDGEKQHGALQAAGLEGRGNEDVGVENQPKRKHWAQMPGFYFRDLIFGGFAFRARAALMIRSICAEVREAVPLRFDSSPMAVITSGSGEARRT